MKTIRFLHATTLCAALALAPNTSHAQPATDKIAVANAQIATERAGIRVKNVPSGFVAYWLDPNHQMVPQQIQISRENSGSWTRESGELPRQPGNANGPRDLKLPDGIESIVSVEPQNVLQIKGTAAGIEKLKKLVIELDVPLNQVEVEAQFFSMSPQTLKALPLKFVVTEGGTYAPLVTLVPPTVGLSAELNKLLANKKTQLITAPRVTAIDGLTAQLYSAESRPLLLSPRDKRPDDVSNIDWQWSPGTSVVKMETGFTCTPIFHGDVIKLFTRSTLNDRNANVSANVRDGETFAVVMPTDKVDAAKRTVIFVTTRVIRRAGEETARAPQVGGTKIGMIR